MAISKCRYDVTTPDNQGGVQETKCIITVWDEADLWKTGLFEAPSMVLIHSKPPYPEDFHTSLWLTYASRCESKCGFGLE